MEGTGSRCVETRNLDQAASAMLDGWTRESVVGELGLFADEGASGDGEAASAKSAED
jgi:hypothetical protein